jgi:hypothetical protein
MDTKTLYSKLATVPAPIKAWLGSDVVVDGIDKMDNQFTLPSGSAGVIAKLIQRLQIKDISPEYFSGELASELNLEKDKAVHITGEIKKNIFSHIGKDLADYGIDLSLLDKFQMPVTKTLTSDAPKIIQETAPVKPAPLPVNKMAPAPAVAPTPTMPSPAPTPAAPAPQKPSSTSDIGWSKTQSSGPVVKLDISNVPPVPPKAPVTPAPQPQQSRVVSPAASIAPHGAVSEFDRLSATKVSIGGMAPISAAPTPPAPPKPPAPAPAPAPEPAPMMLHQDTTFRAAPKNAGFTLSRPDSGAEIKMSPGKPPAAPRPAFLEFSSTAPSAPKPPAPPTSSSTVVHYTEFKPSLSSVPTADSGPRNVSQITPPKPMSTPSMTSVPVPKPPKPPTPAPMAPTSGGTTVPMPQPPRAAQPPTPPGQSASAPASAEKVIIKNFP